MTEGEKQNLLPFTETDEYTTVLAGVAELLESARRKGIAETLMMRRRRSFRLTVETVFFRNWTFEPGCKCLNAFLDEPICFSLSRAQVT